MEGPTSKKTKEPPKRANHKGNIKFPNPSCPQKHIKIMEGEINHLFFQLNMWKQIKAVKYKF
jgi:hypothetical protein